MERYDEQDLVDLGSASEETRGGLVGIPEQGGKDFAGIGLADDD